MPLSTFHPAVSEWFSQKFGPPTDVQEQAWPSIAGGNHTLIAAPTGSGKTLAAFLSVIDSLLKKSLEGRLPEKTEVVYISPLKALSNDIQRNLQEPLKGISQLALDKYLADVKIRTALRTGDTSASDRAAMLKNPPHILVTTPESLYLLVTSEKGRIMLSGVHTVIVDEIHAVFDDKRGTHLTLSIERLEALTGKPLQRIGISATQKPIDEVAKFLVGKGNFDENGNAKCTIVNTGHKRELDLGIEVPNSPLTAVMANEVWEEIYGRLVTLINEHQTTLIFVNTRRLAERLSKSLSERLGDEVVASHHGSMSKDHRFQAEQNLKAGKLRVIVATASLELGIDIGSVDLVCQIGSPRSISVFLQRVGRSGHYVGGMPKGRIFPLTRDELIECSSLFYAFRKGILDKLILPEKPTDILAQQIVAEVACMDWDEKELYERFTRAYPYRDLTVEDFSSVLKMISDGFSERKGRRSALIHHDVINGQIKGRKGSRMVAIMNGGAIPDTFDYDVVLEPSGAIIGTLNEDFSIESAPGDIFQLGNNSWMILRVETGKVRVQDANGLPPSIPFWLGEAPGRTEEVSKAVSDFREEVGDRIDYSLILPKAKISEGEEPVFSDVQEWGKDAMEWMDKEVGIPPFAAEQIAHYLASGRLALGVMPSQNSIVMERFFDEAGDMHLVIHAPFGSRMNRAWGLALRKRFCRNFNFELQAAATEEAIILSLSSTHSFPLDEVFSYLNSKTVREILIQAIFDAPVFEIRWRWNASRALAIIRRRNGKRVAPQLQRMQAEDLVAMVFPDQLACLENIVGDREIPDHPLVKQTVEDCLTEAMDVERLERMLRDMEAGKIDMIAKDLREPSPMAQEIINAKPYAFLDPAPLEERRTLAIRNRRWLDPSEAAELGQLDDFAIERVKEEAWPSASNADELHDALLFVSFFTEEEIRKGSEGMSWDNFFEDLERMNRALWIEIPTGKKIAIASERLPLFFSAYPGAIPSKNIELPPAIASQIFEPEHAFREIVRGRLEASGPVMSKEIAVLLGEEISKIDMGMYLLEGEGFAFRGNFRSEVKELEWCERRLLQRIHRYTIDKLRKEIQPVSSQDFMRFLFGWHRLIPGDQPEGVLALQEILNQLEGFEAAAAAWEGDILPARMEEYDPSWLDMNCLSGRVTWGRFTVPATVGKKSGPIRTSPISIVNRTNLPIWRSDSVAVQENAEKEMSAQARAVFNYLKEKGACFFDDIAKGTSQLQTHIENALAELVSWGLVTSDSFTGLRALLAPQQNRTSFSGRNRKVVYSMEQAGRWSLIEPRLEEGDGFSREELTEIARVLLRRYGVVFRRLADAEKNLPPWGQLLKVFRRMEARGEVRGGRFVEGMYGEQFALAEAVGQMRNARKAEKYETLIVLSASDPLNLAGVILPGEKVATHSGNRILFCDGVAVAVLESSEIKYLVDVPPAKQYEWKNALVQKHIVPQLRGYLSK